MSSKDLAARYPIAASDLLVNPPRPKARASRPRLSLGFRSKRARKSGVRYFRVF